MATIAEKKARSKTRKSVQAGKDSGPVRPPSGSELYDRIAARASAHILEASRRGRDIAPAPAIANRRRRTQARKSLKKFLETYFRGTFALRWSADHLKAIARLEQAIDGGGQYALAMPRGQGKTSLVLRAALWAVLTGRRRFVVIVAATERLAEQALDALKAELEHNVTLLADWPKAVYPIRRLESQARRCVGQLYDGARTRIVWQGKRLVMPMMPGPDNEASGAVLYVAGLTGAIRGLSYVDAEGRTVRPDLVLVDDPQDRESARSVVQTAERIAILNGDLLGLAGPDRRVTAVATVTVIVRDDLADQLLDPTRSPAWSSDRCKLVYRWPDRQDLWEKYAELRAEGFLPGGDRGKAATTFYRSNRAEMDRGAEVAWPQRYAKGELSAIQHAYNLKLDRGEASFNAEYQNEPPDPPSVSESADPVAIASRVSGFERYVAPPEAEKVTVFIDVGGGLLWHLVSAWDDKFGGSVLDYGPWPGQRSRMFLARNADPTLTQKYPSAAGEGAAIYSGLQELVGQLLERDWKRSDGASLSISRILIDSGWASEVVRLFIRQHARREIMTPSKGVGIGAHQTAIGDYHRRPGEKIGDGWILGLPGADRLRLLRFDSNHWKSRVAGMLGRPMGTRGGITLFGSRPVEHEMLAIHLTSEYPTRVEARGNAVDVWQRRPDRENHLLDCLVGSAVAASLEGLSPLAVIGGDGGSGRQKKPRVSLDELKRRTRA